MIPLTGSSESLFGRIGSIGGLIKNLKSYLNTQYTKLTSTSTGLVQNYNNEPDLQAEVGDNYISILQDADTGIGSFVQQLTVDTINRMVFRDNAQLNQNLTQSNIVASLAEVIRQMNIAGATIQAMTVTGSTQPFSNFQTNIGNGVPVVSTVRPFDGRTLENAFAETITLTCSQDSYSGGATAFNEPFAVTGQGSEPDFFAFDWPLGSNCSSTLNAIDGNTSNGSGNLLTNSGFETFTNNVPNNWTLAAGVPGTNIFQESSLVYDGVSAIRFLGDGATQTQITQQFGISTGSSSTLNQQFQYSGCLFLRRDGVAANQGTLNIDLVDENGVLIRDAAGNQNTISIDLTKLGVIYAPYTFVFRTPVILPEQQTIRLTQTVPYSNGRSFYVDKMSYGIMNQSYTSGPFISCHSGNIPFLQGDYAYATISNSRGSGGTLSTFQTLLAQLLSQYVFSLEVIFPSSQTPSISDALIQ